MALSSRIGVMTLWEDMYESGEDIGARACGTMGCLLKVCSLGCETVRGWSSRAFS